MQAALGAREHPRAVPLPLQVVQAGVHAAGAPVFLQGLAERLAVVPDHVHGAGADQPDRGTGAVAVRAVRRLCLPARAGVKDGVELSEHGAGFLSVGAFQLPARRLLI